MTTNDDLDALTNEARSLAMTGVAGDDPRRVDLDRRRLTAWFAALTQRLIALGQDPTDAPRDAATMIAGWDKFTDYDSMETGGRQCDSWMDPEVVRLLDAALRAHFIGKEPYPGVPA
jgi:hypothetical protein